LGFQEDLHVWSFLRAFFLASWLAVKNANAGPSAAFPLVTSLRMTAAF
jgi:hypothetical protein